MLRRRVLLALSGLLLALLAWGCSGSGDEPSADQPAAASQPAAVTSLDVSSSAFSEKRPRKRIPHESTCYGANVSPPLKWSGVPEGAESLALIMEDLNNEEDKDVSSSAFSEKRPRKRIPHESTCYGANVSPPLKWSGVPEGAESLALIMEDLNNEEDKGVHWVLYNIPQNVTEPEGISTSTEVLPDGTTQGTNDGLSLGYSGPCPSVVVMQYSEHFSKNPLAGPHTYAFTVYALDAMLELGPAATRAELVSAMQGHVLALGETMGKYAAAVERKVYGSEN